MSECVGLKDHIERILSEREKALVLAAKPVETRLEYLTSRIEKVENQQSRMVGIAMGLAAMSGIVGMLIGHYWK